MLDTKTLNLFSIAHEVKLKGYPEGDQMAQSVRCLLDERMDPRIRAPTPVSKPAASVCTRNLSAGGAVS